MIWRRWFALHDLHKLNQQLVHRMNDWLIEWNKKARPLMFYNYCSLDMKRLIVCEWTPLKCNYIDRPFQWGFHYKAISIHFDYNVLCYVPLLIVSGPSVDIKRFTFIWCNYEASMHLFLCGFMQDLRLLFDVNYIEWLIFWWFFCLFQDFVLII